MTCNLTRDRTGDRGQRYEVRVTWRESGEEVALGWTDKADGGALADTARLWPAVRDFRVIDREADQGKREGIGMHFIFDTETAGLPKSYNAPASDLDNWPRVVQVAFATFDFLGQPVLKRAMVIRPEGFEIPDEAAKIHGITTERARKEGVPLADVLRQVELQLARAQIVVAHNLSFDEPVLAAEFKRAGRERDPFAGKSRVCTMRAGTEKCALQFSGRGGGRDGRGFKWPKLPELHAALFEQPCEEKHEAAHDVEMAAKCYFEMRRLGIIKT